MDKVITNIKVKPFLRWAGGKGWLTKSIRDFLPKEFNDYYEPFLGGSSIFIYLKSNGLIKGDSFLSDFNDELINSYIQIQQNFEPLVKSLKKHKNSKEYYYEVRAKKPRSNIEKASRFIYLNKTSYNGIYRVNRKGEYNVPYGNRKGNDLFGIDNIKELNKLFGNNVNFNFGDFEMILENLNEKDLVFLDPPYTVAHENNGFIQYNQKIFQWNDQKRLASLLEKINNKGAFFILTNAAHISIAELFSGLGKKYKVQRHSTIGGKGASRERVNEYIFTNI